MTAKNMKFILLGSVLVMGLTGCGQGYKTNTSSLNQKSSSPQGSETLGDTGKSDSTEAIQQAQKAAVSAEQAMADAQAAVKSITDENGKIKLSLFTSKDGDSTQAQGLLAPIVNKLRAAFDKVFSKVELAKAQFNQARGQLADVLARLDQANPNHSAQIQELMAQIARLDVLEGQLSARMHSLASKMDLVLVGIQTLVATATSAIPGFGMIAGLLIDMYLLDDVKALIAEIKMRLLSF